MMKRALANGIEASYVLMDSGFTLPPQVKAIVAKGLDVIGMVKEIKQRYNVNVKMAFLKQLYRLTGPVQSNKRNSSFHSFKIYYFTSILFYY
jgi:hypothetical protein